MGFDSLADRIKPSQIWRLSETMSLAFTARRYRGADRKRITETRRFVAAVAFPIYLVTVLKTWFERTGYALGTNTVVTVVDRRRSAAVRRRYAVAAVVVAALLAAPLAGALMGIEWLAFGGIAVILFLVVLGVLVFVSGGVEVARGAVARRGKQPSPKAALRRLDPRWYIEGLAQRPHTSGGFEFALETISSLASVGDGAVTIARDPFVRMVYLRMGFEPTEEHPDVLYRVF